MVLVVSYLGSSDTLFCLKTWGQCDTITPSYEPKLESGGGNVVASMRTCSNPGGRKKTVKKKNKKNVVASAPGSPCLMGITVSC